MNRSPKPAASGANEETPLIGDNGQPMTPNTSARMRAARDKVVSMMGGRQGVITFLYCVGLLVSAVGNSIFFKKMTNAMPNYPYFLSQLTTVVYIPIFFSAVWYELKFTNYITDEMWNFPKTKYFWMGAFDSISGVLMLFGGVHTSGSTQALLGNAIIPVTMGLSVLAMRKEFKRMQYVGATIILLGVGVVLLPQLMGSVVDSENQPLFNLLFLISVVPSALSSVYKEIAFQDADMDVNLLQAWVAVWQMVFGLCLIPLNTMSFLGPSAVPWNQLGDALVDGANCMFGTNTVLWPNCYRPGQPVEGMKPCDLCHGAWVPVTLYLVFNCAFNVFIILVIKYGGAALLYIIMTLRLPLVQIAFTMPIVLNPPDHFPFATGVGLGVILVGLIMYRWSAATKVAAADQEDVVVVVAGSVDVGTIRRRIPVQLQRSATQLRGGLYSRLGVIASPVTPHSARGSPARGGNSGRGRTPTRGKGGSNKSSGQSNYVTSSGGSTHSGSGRDGGIPPSKKKHGHGGTATADASPDNSSGKGGQVSIRVPRTP